MSLEIIFMVVVVVLVLLSVDIETGRAIPITSRISDIQYFITTNYGDPISDIQSFLTKHGDPLLIIKLVLLIIIIALMIVVFGDNIRYKTQRLKIKKFQ